MSIQPVSVIIPAYNARATIERCLESLQSQTARAFEVIVVNSAADGTAEIVAEKFPETRLFNLNHRLLAGQARNVGATQARYALLAFTDADCIVAADWIEQISAAHASPHAVIGGAVENANPENIFAWAYYFSRFSHWLPEQPAGRMREIPTCCLSIKRAVFEQFGPFPDDTRCEDTALNWQLARAGHVPYFNPALRVAHLITTNLNDLLAHEFELGRSFGAFRLRAENFSTQKRLAYSLGAPLLPFVLFARIARRVLRIPRYRKKFLAAAPLVWSELAGWACGEGAAYWTRSAGIRFSKQPTIASAFAKPTLHSHTSTGLD